MQLVTGSQEYQLQMKYQSSIQSQIAIATFLG